jgi:hypothetical protein
MNLRKFGKIRVQRINLKVKFDVRKGFRATKMEERFKMVSYCENSRGFQQVDPMSGY